MEINIEVLKQIEIEIFKEFIKICKKYNLRYYLLGGTMLGAVRHKGFIPWDDDIDVGMPRKDYEKFLEIAQENLPNHLFVQTNKTDPELPFVYCKIRNSNTTFIETSSKNLNINHGIFMDVFPLDNYPVESKKQKKFRKKKRIYSSIMATVYTPKNKNFKAKIFRTIAKLLSLFVSPNKAVKKLEFMYKSIQEEEIWANNGGAWDIKEVCPSDWYGEGVELEFEGLTVIAPKKYDLWLTRVYGDYMKLPPEEKRITHHYTEVIDTGRSYKEYLKTRG